MQAELAAIHNHLRQHSAQVGAMVDRVDRVESRLKAGGGSQAGSGSTDKGDPNHLRISFKGFTIKVWMHVSTL